MAKNSYCGRYHTSASLGCLAQTISDRFPDRRAVVTSSSDMLEALRAGSDLARLRAKWGWIVALGVVCLVAVSDANPDRMAT
jgi:hypothetical protein